MTPTRPQTVSVQLAINRRAVWIVAGLFIVVGGVAWSRVGLLDLPSIPSDLTLESSGLGGLDGCRKLDQFIRSESTDAADALDLPDNTHRAAVRVRDGYRTASDGRVAEGLDLMRQGIRLDPGNLALANAYRMIIFRLKLDFLRTAKGRASLVPVFPQVLSDQPRAFFEELNRARPTRETRLNLALAWVDEMLLFPALEIKAPASVAAVDLLTEVIDGGDRSYVPALFARGLNHLHRPARLVWPESSKTTLDAAAQDIGRCVAIGRALGVGSKRLQATLAMALGDAYVKAGRLGVARSWWQIAQNACTDGDLQDAVRRRYGWSDADVLDRLEEELDRCRSDVGRPMTDLAMMWEE